MVKLLVQLRVERAGVGSWFVRLGRGHETVLSGRMRSRERKWTVQDRAAFI